MLQLITVILAVIYAISPKLALVLLAITVCVWVASLAIAYLTFHALVAVHDQRRGAWK